MCLDVATQDIERGLPSSAPQFLIPHCVCAAADDKVRWFLRDERLQQCIKEVDSAPNREQVSPCGWIAMLVSSAFSQKPKRPKIDLNLNLMFAYVGFT